VSKNPSHPRHQARLPCPANDNPRRTGALDVEVLIPADSPITQAEIEVFAALLDDWDSLADNDNETVTND